ncbi:MAG: succinate dehydrogenase/fumarate reductase cytochrome b subunit [Thermodesulfovibrio sp.]|nr:succinate dehydrogenase/fumarate reductase cytochrome b subunit [Thermodesulfovibrio sp.]
MNMLESSVGRKLVMSVTGLSMIAFVLVHLLGNTTLFYGPDGINAYAEALHRFGALVWAFRLLLLTVLLLHVFYGIQLTLENRAAKPRAYAIKSSRATTLAGRSMVWSGLLIGGFIFFHLLHFTLQLINPELAAGRHFDSLGRPDVFMMVVLSFRKMPVSLLYLGALAALGLHLMHSLQGAVQTLGLNNERTLPKVMKAGVLAAILIFLGYAAFPITVFTGLLR